MTTKNSLPPPPRKVNGHSNGHPIPDWDADGGVELEEPDADEGEAPASNNGREGNQHRSKWAAKGGSHRQSNGKPTHNGSTRPDVRNGSARQVPRKPPPPPRASFQDCGPLLHELRKPLNRYRDKTSRMGTTLLLELLPLTEDVDQAMILSELISLEPHATWVPTDRRGRRVPGERAGVFMGIAGNPRVLLGIPDRRFRVAVGRLAGEDYGRAKEDQKPRTKFIIRRPHKMPPKGVKRLDWQEREGKWLLNVNWTPELRKIVRRARKDKDLTLYVPWTLRYMLSGPAPGKKRDVEDGSGTLLTLLVMKHHTMKNGKPLPTEKYKGVLWSYNTLEKWGQQLGYSPWQAERVIDRMEHVLERDWRGARFSRKTLLRPKLVRLLKLWAELGKPYRKNLKSGLPKPKDADST